MFLCSADTHICLQRGKVQSHLLWTLCVRNSLQCFSRHLCSYVIECLSVWVFECFRAFHWTNTLKRWTHKHWLHWRWLIPAMRTISSHIELLESVQELFTLNTDTNIYVFVYTCKYIYPCIYVYTCICREYQYIISCDDNHNYMQGRMRVQSVPVLPTHNTYIHISISV